MGECDEEQAFALGATMAMLHEHAETFRLPDGATLPLFDEPLLGDENLLLEVLPLPARDAGVLTEALAECGRRFAQLHAGSRPVVLHADLHGGNLKWHDGRLAVFDLDDAGMGLPSFDLAVSTFYLRTGDRSAEATLREGYLSRRPVPPASDAEFEALVASRQLLLANSLLASSTASLRADATAYLDVTVERLRTWLDTGRFTRGALAQP